VEGRRRRAERLARPGAPTVAPSKLALVQATMETQPVDHGGDAADDPAIFVHPTDPAKSAIIATDKKGGMLVYDLTGKLLQYLPDGKMNNVDLRAGFKLGGKTSPWSRPATGPTRPSRSTRSIPTPAC
jgi:myo-inositol-hexaphosphate 3-phosphohydrolase